MADHFLGKLRVANEDFVEADGAAVLERHEAMRALLSERAGPEVAAMFAEPLISRGNFAGRWGRRTQRVCPAPAHGPWGHNRLVPIGLRILSIVFRPPGESTTVA